VGEVLKSLLRRPKLFIYVLWMVLFAYGLGRTLWEHEWGNAVFCGVFLILGVLGVARAVRLDRARAEADLPQTGDQGAPPIHPS